MLGTVHDIQWRRQWHPTPVFLPGKSHGRRSLVGCSPWGREESDTTSLSLSLFTFMHGRRKRQPTPVFLPGESQGWGSLVGCRLGSHRVGHDWSDSSSSSMIYSKLNKSWGEGRKWAKYLIIITFELLYNQLVFVPLIQYSPNLTYLWFSKIHIPSMLLLTIFFISICLFLRYSWCEILYKLQMDKIEKSPWLLNLNVSKPLL